MTLMSPQTPKKLLIIRPDAYGDIVLFQPVLQVLRETWSQSEIVVLIQERYADLTPLLPTGIRWLTTKCDPYRAGPTTNPPALDALQREVTKFAPDCVIAACFDKTWLEAVVAAWTPSARQISLGPYNLDMISRVLLGKTVPVEWPNIYREIVKVDADSLDWDKNLRLARHLIGKRVTPSRPQLNVPEKAREQATELLQAAALKPGNFVACCAAGVSKVSIKAWPAERYGEVLAWLEKKHKYRALLLGHENEGDILTAVRSAAQAHGARPAVWKGRDGQIATLAALLQQSQFYFGNDTGALHLAAALDRPVVSIFGGGHWPRFKPVAQRSVCVVQPLPCFGCGWDCSFGDAPCVKTIPIAPVRKAIDRLLTATRKMQQDIVVETGVTAAQRELITSVAATTRQNRHVRVRTEAKGAELLSRNSLDKLIEQLQFSEADRAARIEVIQQQGQRATELEAEVHRWLEETKKYSAQEQQSESLQTRLRAELEQERSQGEALAKENLDLLGQLEKVRRSLATIETDRARIAGEFEQERIKTEALAGEKLDLLGQLESTAQNLTAAGTDRARLTTDLATSDSHVTRLQVELAREKHTNESLTGDLLAAQEKIRVLTTRLDAQSRALDGTVKSLEAARARIRELQERLSKIEEHALVRLLKACRLGPS